MIDFSQIPGEVRDSIMTEYSNVSVAPSSGVFNYLVSKRCAQLIQSSSEFFPDSNK